MTTQPPSESATTPQIEVREEVVRLKHIVAPEETQSRAKLDTELVAEYAANMQAGEKFPPIYLCKINAGPSNLQGKYVVVDGFHRFGAAQQIKAKTLNAFVFDGSLPDAVHAATGANTNHGLRRTNEDKRRAVIMAIQLDKLIGRVRTDRAIADHVLVHHDTVNSIRHEIDGTTPKKQKKPKAQKEDGPPPDPADPDAAFQVNNPITDPEALEIGDLDEEGILIESPEVLAALKRRGDFDRVLDDIASAKAEVKRLATEPIGAELKSQQIEGDLNGATIAVKFARPYTTCVYGPGCSSSCKACKGRHWITRAIWDRLDNDIKAEAHKRSGEAHAKLAAQDGPPDEAPASAAA